MNLNQWLDRSAVSPPEGGAAFAEYALLVTGIAVVVGVAAAAFGGAVLDLYNSLIP